MPTKPIEFDLKDMPGTLAVPTAPLDLVPSDPATREPWLKEPLDACDTARATALEAIRTDGELRDALRRCRGVPPQIIYDDGTNSLGPKGTRGIKYGREF